MNNVPDSLTTCFQPSAPPTFGQYYSKATDLAKSTGMNATCTQAAQSSGDAESASEGVNTIFGDEKAQVSALQYQRNMAQSGCGQFAINVDNQMQNVNTINCSIQSTSTTVSSQTVNVNSITIETVPLTADEISQKTKIQDLILQTLANLEKLAINSQVKTQAELDLLISLNNSALESYKIILDTYDRSIDITGSTISQTIKQSMTTALSITADQATKIAAAQTSMAQSTAENKLAQDLGVDALAPESKSVISDNISSNQYFSNQNVQATVNKIKLSLSADNTLVITAPGKIDLTNTTIDQNIVSNLVMKALIGEASTVGLQVVSQITTDASNTIASDGKSAGSEALVNALGQANAAAIAAGSPPDPMGGIMGLIIVGILVLCFGVVKTGSAMMNNAIFIMSIVSIIVGVVFITKGSKVFGSILIFCGIAGIVFGGVMKMRLASIK